VSQGSDEASIRILPVLEQILRPGAGGQGSMKTFMSRKLPLLSGYGRCLSATSMKSDIQLIKEDLSEIKQMLHELLLHHEAVGMMKLSNRSLHQFLQDEPDIYTLEDAQIVYRCKE